jgi:carbon monoxide dehydrogenase subunit G
MKLTREFAVTADPGRVWDYFQDVPAVAACLPGAELTEVGDDGSHSGAVTFKLGPMTARFEGTASIQADATKRSARVIGKGRDRSGGSQGKIVLEYQIDAADGGSRVQIEAEITLSGPAAQVGRPGLIDEIATRLLNDFVACAEARLAAPDMETAAAIRAPNAGGMRLVIASAWSALIAAVRRLFDRSIRPGQ